MKADHSAAQTIFSDSLSDSLSIYIANLYSYQMTKDLSTQTFSPTNYTGVCGQGLSYVFAAPPIKYFVIFLRLSIANPNPNPNLKP